MNKKKGFIFSALASIFAIYILPNVSAYFDISNGPNDVIRMVIDFLGPFFGALLGVDQFGDQYFFARVLLLILIYIICSISLESADIFKGKKGVIFIVSAVVAILGARYIGELNIIQSILLPYGAVSMAMIVLIPFLVCGLFIHKAFSSGITRRAAWVVLIVIFAGLWWTRQEDMKTQYDWIYSIGIWAGVAVVIFDSKLHEYFGLIEAAEFKRSVVKKQIADVEAELDKYAKIQSPSKTTQDVIKHLEERRNSLAKKL